MNDKDCIELHNKLLYLYNDPNVNWDHYLNDKFDYVKELAKDVIKFGSLEMLNTYNQINL